MTNRREAKDEQIRVKQEEDQLRLDELLQKISDTGMESLSKTEKAFLEKMSSAMKKKRESE